MRIIWFVLFAISAFGQCGSLPLTGVGGSCSQGGAASWGSIVQRTSAVYSTCGAFNSPWTCTITVPSTGAGNLLIVMTEKNGTDTQNASLTAGACNGSWQHAAGALLGNSAGSTEIDYCLKSNSGITSIVATWTTFPTRSVLGYREISYTGTASLVDAQSAVNAAFSTTPSGVTLTLSGATAYATCQVITNQFGAVTAITSPYNTDFAGLQSSDSVEFGGVSCTTSGTGTAPTWTQANGNSVVAGIAFGVN